MYNYIINWFKLARTFTFKVLRKTKFLSFLAVMMSGVQYIHANFLAYQTAVLYVLSYNSQVIYLTKLLNDRWDNIGRGIYIENLDADDVYLWNEDEDVPPLYVYNNYNAGNAYAVGEYCSYGTLIWKKLSSAPAGTIPVEGADWTFFSTPIYIVNYSEYATMLDFIVWVPAAVTFNMAQMQAVINTYKLAGKTYSIQTF